ncbi:MAG: PEP-CTERM sorting domain-containing protein [Desulfobacteria bacterium]
MRRFSLSRFWTVTFLVASTAVLPVGTAMAVPVILDVNGYGYNTINSGTGNGYDGLPGAIGCGPTTGAMIMEYWARHGAPGLSNGSTADARLMGTSAYMNTNAAGFGTPINFQYGMESFALARGYNLDAVLHVSPTDSAAGWAAAGYNTAAGNHDIAFDAAFWNTTTWQIDPTAFLNFLGAEINAGNPVSITVNGDPNNPATVPGGGGTHWMAGVGYDLDTGMWAGYNTWDGSIHWYTPTSGFYDIGAAAGVQVPNMSIAYVRTFDFLGAVDGGNGNGGNGGNPVPEPGTMLLLGSGLVGLLGYGRRHMKK